MVTATVVKQFTGKAKGDTESARHRWRDDLQRRPTRTGARDTGVDRLDAIQLSDDVKRRDGCLTTQRERQNIRSRKPRSTGGS
jgi:hypothetical protein